MIVITNFDITVGYWMIGDDLEKKGTGLRAGKRGLSLPSEAVLGWYCLGDLAGRSSSDYDR